jgi:GAF domain-containing protein
MVLMSLSTFSGEGQVFTKKDERLLERLANQAAIALRNASRIDELKVLNEIGREVSAELHYRRLLVHLGTNNTAVTH